MTNWFKVDGERLADEIFRKLVFSENGELTNDNIFDIYEAFDEPVFRKTEFFTWGILNENPEIKREKDEKGHLCLVWLPRKLKEQTGAGMLDCRSAIKRFNGDMEKAKEWVEWLNNNPASLITRR